MQFTFGADYYLNYSFLNSQTTIRKANASGDPNDLTTLAVFQWSGFGGGKIWFGGRAIRAAWLVPRKLSSCAILIPGRGRATNRWTEGGPDNQTYK
ncbi:hypothetical protein M404DRAFT_26064 [Pisolithus tinctorius Marx 270]|uniref:Uncharacterized protein n=1 Tax=Pisolithus tinctorius Marx 270 TaxID=870435 RepID=A0A0C3J6D5_PISTI|nr:hypothetical protein M404DRAFT_26064 [Pisolithus tinctorius Marx 270]